MSKEQVSVEFFDTTLRDGAQALPAENQFPESTKSEIADYIALLGVTTIEAGFPRTPGDGVEVRAVAEDVGQRTYPVRNWHSGVESSVSEFTPVIAGLSRTTPEDIDATWEAVSPAHRPRIHTFVSTDPEHMASKFPGKTPDDVLEMGRKAVRYARNVTSDRPEATVEFSAEAATTTDMNYLERVVKTAIEEGADVINLPDTVGQRNPFWMRNFYEKAIGWVVDTNPDTVISAHNHNDLGNAVSNSWSLIDAAAAVSVRRNVNVRTQLEGTICGLGERAGNADIFPTAAHLHKFGNDLPAEVTWQFNPEHSVGVAADVLAFAGIEVGRQNPIVGSDTNVHRSGIHSDGVIKGGHRIYTPYDPVFWGHSERARHEDGRYQGKHGKSAAGN